MSDQAWTTVWNGRVEIDEPAGGGRWHQTIRPASEDGHGGVTLIGFAVDEGVRRNEGRPGAAGGPAAIRQALRNVARQSPIRLWDDGDVVGWPETEPAAVVSPSGEGMANDPNSDGTSPDLAPAGMPSARMRMDSLHLPSVALELAQQALAARIRRVRERGSFPLVLGGGHEVAWGSFLGLVAGEQRPKSLLVVNLDAHLDLRESPDANSGTAFQQIQAWCHQHAMPAHYAAFGISRFANTQGLFRRAQQWEATIVEDQDLQSEPGLRAATARLDELLGRYEAVYLSVCLDVLPAAVAPGVSAPAALGVPLYAVESLIDHVAASGRLVLADLAELNPHFDRDGQTARVAARLVARLAECPFHRENRGVS